MLSLSLAMALLAPASAGEKVLVVGDSLSNRQTANAEAEITASSGGDAVWALFPSWRTTFTSYTNQSWKVVIFFGGNDLALGNTDPLANPVVDGQPRQIDYESVYAVTKRILDPAPFEIGGLAFYKEADDDCRPRYLFSGDGFHPNTPVHAKVAQVVADAFLEKYPEMAPGLVRLSDREILTGVLGLPGDLGYGEWMTEAGVPVNQRGPLSDPDKDGMPNAMEYALAGRRPHEPDPEPPFSAVREPHPFGTGEVLTVTWQPRFEENAYCDLIPQLASGMEDWIPFPAEQVARLPDGRRQVQLAVVPGQTRFFRLAAVRDLGPGQVWN